MGCINHTMKSVIIHYVNFGNKKYDFLEFPLYKNVSWKKKCFLVQESLQNLEYVWDIL